MRSCGGSGDVVGVCGIGREGTSGPSTNHKEEQYLRRNI